MSIVAEILQSATKIDVEVINKKVPELKKTVEILKNDVISNVENIYVKYSVRHKTTSDLLNKTKECEQNLSSLKEKADYIVEKDLTKTDRDLQNNIGELQIIELKMKILSNLQNILTLLDLFNQELKLTRYVKCVEIVKELKTIIERVPADEHLDIIDQLKMVICEKQFTLQEELTNIFTSNIEIKKVHDKPLATIKVKKPNEEVKIVLQAYHLITEQIRPLNCAARNLWEYVFVPIVNQEVDLTEKEDSSYLYLHINMKNCENKSDYKTVFANLEKTLQFLGNNFSYDLSKDQSALDYIGSDIRDNLSELIIKNCLRDTIPSNIQELQNYKIVIDATKKLEKALLEAHIFTKETTSILDYANNVDILFINKKCEQYQRKATDIMKKDLHDIMEVGVPYDPEYPLGKEKLEFPQCSISKSVNELLGFCENILQKATSASPECCGRLFITVTNILLKYRNFVPEYHKSYLATLPQQIAVFLNNCNYISYRLVQWNSKYSPKLRSILSSSDFIAESSKFPIVGLEMFSKFVDGQVKQIDEIMEGAQLDGPTIEKLDLKTEKCVRQCLRQQELLKTVWQKVLSYDIYNKNIGLIVNALCKKIITAITKLEDIPSQVAEDLADIVKLVINRASKLFINPSEVTLYVPLWYKLNELSFVLNARLADINDRWADGKGPLALQFEGEELKQLIKALFQNTDRRAAVLSKITSYSIKK